MILQGTESKSTPDSRRYELDWLRVLAFGLLILYHCGMYYVSDWGWHVKSTHQSEGLQSIMLWSGQWRMSLLFLISGSAVAFLLQKMTAGRFYWSRISRLLVPLGFGMAVVVVPQVYVEMASQGRLEGIGYWQFWVAYLDQGSDLFVDNKTIGDWHVTWNHLWFLMYIYVYSLVALAGSLLLRLPIFASALSQLERHVAPVVMVVLIPLTLLYLNSHFLADVYPASNKFIGDYYNHGRYFLAFAMGIFFVRAPGYWLELQQWRKSALLAALLSYSGVLFLYHGGEFGTGTLERSLASFVWVSNGWLWILAVCGWAQRLLNTKNAVIRYLNGGVYCYYILHQTVIIALAYSLSPFALGPVLEPIVLVLITIALCLGGYEVLRQIPGLRLLFGITAGPKSKPLIRKWAGPLTT